MKIKLLVVISMIFLLTSCGSKLNPEWYPHGWSGKDTVYVLGDGKFNLNKTTEGIHLSMYKTDGYNGVLLAFVKDYKHKGNKLYVYSEEGYCVADETENTAKVLITVDKQHMSNLVGEDEAITYLSSFDEFTEEEQKKFKEME